MKKIKSVQYYELINGQKFALINNGGILTLINEKKKKVFPDKKYDKINEIMDYLYSLEKKD